MISRVIAEFDSQQAAQYAVTRAKESIGYVYSGSILTSAKNKTSSFPHNNWMTALNTHSDFLSSVYNNSANDEYEGLTTRSKVSACIICGSAAVENVMSLLHAMGAENIRSAV